MASSPRVLHLNAGNILGGIESVLLTLAQAPEKCAPFEKHFALAFEGEFANRMRRSGARVHILPEAHLRNPFSVLRSRRALTQLMKGHTFDVVISHSIWCQVIFETAVKRLRVPLIYWMHSEFDGHWLQRLACRNRPEFVICNSRYTQSTLNKVYRDVPSEVIYNPVQIAGTFGRRERMRSDLDATPQTIVILMASRMEAWKGHINLLHAASQIKTNVDWVVWIAGSAQGPAEEKYLKSLRDEVSRLQLTRRVRFLGQRSDVPDLMRAADIYCQPNLSPEPFGVVFVEALQAGVPIVTYCMGGPREILDANCAILLEPGEIPGLASALVRLIEDAPLRASLGHSGPSRAMALCDPAQQIRRIYEVVSLVSQRGSRR